MADDNDLDGKVLVVTGGGSGIGLATARMAHARGAKVLIVDRAPEAEEIADELEGEFVIGNVDDPALWDRVAHAATRIGGPHIVHLNAGIYGSNGPIEELDIDVYRSVMGANVDGVVLGVRAMVPALVTAGGGAIVATASLAGLVPFPPNPLYTATKHAVVGLIRSLAPTLTAQNITINAVCPAPVDTPMTVGAAEGIDLATLGFKIIPVDEVAAAVLELATTEGTGRCHAILPEREPIPWTFTGPSQLAPIPQE